MKASVLVLVILLALTACAGSTVVKTAQISKATAEGILYDARVSLNKGVIAQPVYDKIKAGYNLWAQAQTTLINAQQAYDRAPTQDNQASLTAAIDALTKQATSLVAAATSAGIAIKQ
jgi:predicted lipoprotein